MQLHMQEEQATAQEGGGGGYSHQVRLGVCREGS